MQQRRPRLGDVLDDYCPRERRITNHAVVAMIDDQVKQTRCATCDAEHEYKEAKIPAPRRKKSGGALASDLPEALVRPRAAAPAAEAPVDGEEPLPPEAAGPSNPAPEADIPAAVVSDESIPDESDGPAGEEPAHDDWGHRPLIRATLPRQEGQTPERKAPDFTLRQPGRFDNRNGQRHRGTRPGRPGQGQFRQAQGQPGSRFGGQGQRQGSGPGSRQGHGGQPPRQGSGQPGNRSGSTAGQRGGGRPAGQPRGPRQGNGGRKRGR